MRWWMRIVVALVGVALAAPAGFAQDSDKELRAKLQEAEARAAAAEAQLKVAQVQAKLAAEAAQKAAVQAMQAANAAAHQAKLAEQAAKAQAEATMKEAGKQVRAQHEAAAAAHQRALRAVAEARKSAAEKVVRLKAEKKEPFIGLVTEKVGDALAGQLPTSLGGGGIVVTQVMPKSPAEKAGLKTYDVVVAFNGGAVKSPEDLKAMVLKHKAGDKVSIVVLRAAQKTPLEVELGERESGAFRAQVLSPEDLKIFRGSIGDEFKALDLEKLRDLKGMKIELKGLGDLKDLKELEGLKDRIRIEVDGKVKELSKLKDLEGLKGDIELELKGQLKDLEKVKEDLHKELQLRLNVDGEKLKGEMKGFETAKEDLHKKLQLRLNMDGEKLKSAGKGKSERNTSIGISSNNGKITIHVETTGEHGKREVHSFSGTREEIKAKLPSLPSSVRDSVGKAIEGLDAGGASISVGPGAAGSRVVLRHAPGGKDGKDGKVEIHGTARIVLMDKNGEVKHFDLNLNDANSIQLKSKIEEGLKDLPKEVRVQVEKSIHDVPKVQTRVTIEKAQ